MPTNEELTLARDAALDALSEATCFFNDLCGMLPRSGRFETSLDAEDRILLEWIRATRGYLSESRYSVACTVDSSLEFIERNVATELPAISIDDRVEFATGHQAASQAIQWAWEVHSYITAAANEDGGPGARAEIGRIQLIRSNLLFEIVRLRHKIESRIRREAAIASLQAEPTELREGCQTAVLLPLAPQVKGNVIEFDGVAYTGLTSAQIDIHRVLNEAKGEWAAMKIGGGRIAHAADAIADMPEPLKRLVQQEPHPKGRRRYNPNLVYFFNAD